MIVEKPHPIHQVHDGVINLHSGSKIKLDDPSPGDINIGDIAHALSHICRWGGHSPRFYSVAQHSVLVSYLAPKELRMAGLLHDSPEAYLGDVVKPLKVMLGDRYGIMELKFQAAICKRFKAKSIGWFQIKPFDKRAAEIEYEYFFRKNDIGFTRVFNSEEPCWPPDVAKEIYLSTFNELS